MYLECYGRGSPTVILDAGLRNGASFSSQRSDETHPGPTVLPGVARFTRVCGYDRPGTILTSNPPFEFSRSSPVRMPRTAADAVSDLHTLLKVARVPGPYVFVSHSLGGPLGRARPSRRRRRAGNDMPRGSPGRVVRQRRGATPSHVLGVRFGRGAKPCRR